MSKLLKTMFKRLILASLILLLTIIPYLYLRNDVQAASLTSIKDTMNRLQDTTLSNHTIQFVTPTGVDASTDTITITFESTFAMGSVAFGDMDLEIDTTGDISDCGSFVTSKTLAATPSTSPTWGAAVSGQVVTLTAPTNAASGEIAAGACVQVEIGTNASGGSNQITNATTSGSKITSIAGAFGDSGQLAVPILAGDEVTVSATVDATITSTLSSTTCTITPALLSTTVDSCTYTNQVATNATGGYISTMIEDGEFRDGANEITDVSDGTVDTGGSDEEYGASTSHTNVGPQDILVWDGICETDASDPSEIASPITGTAKTYADHGGPVDETTTLCHSGTIMTTTEAGSYSHLVTHITTGTF